MTRSWPSRPKEMRQPINSYYVARLMRSEKADDKKVVARSAVDLARPKQTGTQDRTFLRGMLKHAPHKEAAVKFLEYLASDDAQRYFADGNNEWPAVRSVKVANPALEKLGPFKADTLPVGSLGMYRAKAQMIFDRAGYR